MKRLLFIVFILHSSLFDSYAQWVYQRPPLVQPYYNIQFINKYTGWVTGSNSIILKTTDRGNNWFQQTVNLSQGKILYGLSMVNDSIGFIDGIAETILKTTNGGSNWQIIRDGVFTQGNAFTGLYFLNQNTGWLCGYGGIVLRTTNGCISFDSINVGSTGPLRNIQFFNSLTGWVCGDVGNLKKSTNGGMNWINMPLLTTANLDMYFLNENTGWTVGEQDNMVFRTTDGGARWDTVSKLPGGNNQYSYSIAFMNFNTGWIGGTYGRIFRTNNGGLNWFNEDYDLEGFVENFSFYNDSTAWCVGGNKIKLRNINNVSQPAQTGWQRQNSNTLCPLKDMYMLNSQTGWIVGTSDTILHTTNSGINWNKISTGGFYDIRSVQFLNEQTGWLSGKEGIILKTTNGGANWINQSMNEGGWWIHSMFFTSEQKGWITLDYGVVFKTTNSGYNWTPVPATVTNHNIYSIYFVDSTRGWLCGDGGEIDHTLNSGLNWSFQNSGTSIRLNSIYFINDSLGWAAGGDREGIIIKTTNAGNSWNSIYNGSQALRKIKFSGPDSGWVVGDSGIVLLTTNSGLIWNRQNTGDYNNFYSTFFTSNGTGWLIGGYGNIFKTTTGGEPIGIVNNNEGIPHQFQISQNYPNPFNPISIIKYELPKSEFVTIKVFNLLGEEVKTLVNNEYRYKGYYSVEFDGSNIASGVYFYRIETGPFIATKKMVLIK